MQRSALNPRRRAAANALALVQQVPRIPSARAYQRHRLPATSFPGTTGWWSSHFVRPAGSATSVPATKYITGSLTPRSNGSTAVDDDHKPLSLDRSAHACTDRPHSLKGWRTVSAEISARIGRPSTPRAMRSPSSCHPAQQPTVPKLNTNSWSTRSPFALVAGAQVPGKVFISSITRASSAG